MKEHIAEGMGILVAAVLLLLGIKKRFYLLNKKFFLFLKNNIIKTVIE